MLDRPRLLLVLSLLSATAAAACTKTEGMSSGTGTAGTASSAPMPSASMTAMASASAAPMAADTASAMASASAAPMASAAGSAATTKAAGSGTPVASASAAAAECGTKPLPDCPLQAWMKANTNPAIASSDLPALATALDKTASFAPAGYTNWATIAKDGAKAAKAGDMTAAKASCRTCHDQYKDKYKKEMRARKI